MIDYKNSVVKNPVQFMAVVEGIVFSVAFILLLGVVVIFL